jgi:inositol-phosphate phosphatase/L-galactose 1-phosphate phosphatase/histidinol-phosphatase
MLDINLIDFAEYLADEAGKTILPFYRQNISIEDKQDSSPVTEADRQVERVIRKLIENNFPDHGVYGEEFEPQNHEAEFVWVIDPIDGTKSFITGRPIFGTLIALVQNKKPVLGVIDQPIIKDRWVGANGETKLNGKRVATRDCNDLSKAYFATTSPFLFEGNDAAKIEEVTKRVKCTLYGGDCYSYGQLAAGGLDLVIESGLKPYDFCALVPVIENAGGVITDWQGKPIDINSNGKIVAAGSAEVHRKILELL